MPASVIITVVVVSIIYMGWVVLAVNWPTKLDPRDRRPDVDGGQAER
ncbi:hypothetical protein [Nocardia anaemiae]|nr:hypothetical protein [Nocardia anaemiae]